MRAKRINLHQELQKIERVYVIQALEHAKGDKSAAAALLSMPRRKFYRVLERLALNDRIRRRPRKAGARE